MSDGETPQADPAQVQAFEDLFPSAQAYFKEFIQVLRAYGIEPDPKMQLHHSQGMNNTGCPDIRFPRHQR